MYTRLKHTFLKDNFKHIVYFTERQEKAFNTNDEITKIYICY